MALKRVDVEAVYDPRVGYDPFEVIVGKNKTTVHPGHKIFDVRDTTKMSPDDIKSLVNSLDARALQGAPQEILDALESGNITHIFRTDAGVTDAAGAPMGSIYFRNKDGGTARWKLPEIAGMNNDAGWNANLGNEIFSTNTAYVNSSDEFGTAELRRVDDVVKQVNQGRLDPVAQGLGGNFDAKTVNYVEAIVQGQSKLPGIAVDSSSTTTGPTVKVNIPGQKKTGPVTPPPGPDPAASAQPSPQAVPTPPSGPDPAGPVNAADPADATVPPKPAPPSIPGNVVDDLTLNAPSANQTAGVKAAQAAAANASANPAPPPPPPSAKITTTPASPAASAINRASRASSGAPLGGRTSQIMSHAKNAAEWVTTGKRGVAGLKIAGAGMLLGIGAQKVMGNRQPVNEEDIIRLEMQRRGM